MSLAQHQMISLVGYKIVFIESRSVEANTKELFVTDYHPVQGENVVVEIGRPSRYLDTVKFMRENKSAFVSRVDSEQDKTLLLTASLAGTTSIRKAKEKANKRILDGSETTDNEEQVEDMVEDVSPPPRRPRRNAGVVDLTQAMQCPIMQDGLPMNDPVIAADGITYERAAIERWFTTRDTSPMTNMRLANKQLTPNYALKAVIDAMK